MDRICLPRGSRFAWVVALVLAAAQPGCSRPSEVELFPLESGRRWTYRQTSVWDDDRREIETVTLRNLGSDGSLTSGSAWRRRSDSGVEYWLRRDNSGVFRVAAKSDLEAEPVPDPAARYVLRAPVAVGTQWQAPTTTYLLRRRTEFPPEIRHSHPAIPMQYVIESVDTPVRTLSGAFEHCVRVRGSARLRLFTDPVNGFQDLPLATLEWYCPGVGLVRVERSEPANTRFLLGGTQTLDLEEWQ